MVVWRLLDAAVRFWLLAVGFLPPWRRRRLDFQTPTPHVHPVQRRALVAGELAPAAARSSLVSWNAHLAH